jgi:hypothetical protein
MDEENDQENICEIDWEEKEMNDIENGIYIPELSEDEEDEYEGLDSYENMVNEEKKSENIKNEDMNEEMKNIKNINQLNLAIKSSETRSELNKKVNINENMDKEKYEVEKCGGDERKLYNEIIGASHKSLMKLLIVKIYI